MEYKITYLKAKLEMLFEDCEFIEEVAHDAENKPIQARLRAAMNELGAAIALADDDV